jgi:hypothetical protein
MASGHSLLESKARIGRFDKGGGDCLFQLTILEVMWYTLQKADPTIHAQDRTKEGIQKGLGRNW